MWRHAGWVGLTVLVALVSFWPWMLGTYVATQAGASRGSTTRALSGWLPELAWLIILVVVTKARGFGRKRRPDRVDRR
jgi:hypothetical protein